MAIAMTTELEGDTLLVHASGFDETLSQVRDYGLAVIQAALAHRVARVLCDEQQLEYRLGVTDTYQAAKLMAASAPTVARVAIVTNPRCVEDARFFEDVAVNRGLTLKAFTDMAAARIWLKEENPDPGLRVDSTDLPDAHDAAT